MFFSGSGGESESDSDREVEDEWDKLARRATSKTKRDTGEGMPFGLQIALFIRFYGYDLYRNSNHPTSDKVIPFKLFELLNNSLGRVVSFEISMNIHAATLSAASIQGGKGAGKVHRVIDQIWAEAMGSETSWK